MADLLAHVLIAYALLTIASWQLESLIQRWIAVGMGGAAIPDLVKLDLVFDARRIERALNIPFDYFPILKKVGIVFVSEDGRWWYQTRRGIHLRGREGDLAVRRREQ